MIKAMVRPAAIDANSFYGSQSGHKKRTKIKVSDSVGDENQIPEKRHLLNGATNDGMRTPPMRRNVIDQTESMNAHYGFRENQWNKQRKKFLPKLAQHKTSPTSQMVRSNGVSVNMQSSLAYPMSPITGSDRDLRSETNIRVDREMSCDANASQQLITDYFQTKDSSKNSSLSNGHVMCEINVSPVTPGTPERNGQPDLNQCQTPKRWRDTPRTPLQTEAETPIGPLVMDEIADHNEAYDLFSEISCVLEPNTPIGLKNLGNTCYMNSIVQSLFALKFFIDDLETKFHSITAITEFPLDFQMTKNLLKLYNQYNGLRTGSTDCSMDQIAGYSKLVNDLSELKMSVGQKWDAFLSSCQQDAAEFFSHVIDKMAEEFDCCQLVEAKNNPVWRNFGFETDNVLKCEKCGNKTKIENEMFHALYLTIPEDHSLQTAFNDFLKDETTGHQCVNSDCGHNRNVLSKGFVKLSKVLFLQLGRYTEDGLKRNEQVIVPQVIQLSVTMNPSEQNIAPSPLATPYRSKLKSVSICNKHSSVVRKITFEDKCPAISDNYEKSVADKESSCQTICNDENTIRTECEVDSQRLSSESVAVVGQRDVKYQLVAVVCHHGISLALGHYTCYVYSIENEKWFECDDNRICETNFDTVQKCSQTSGYCYLYVLSD